MQNEWPECPTARIAELENALCNADKRGAALAARVAELEPVAHSVMRWWADHEFDEAYPGWNMYDEDPEMVVLAKSALAQANNNGDSE